MDRRSLFLLSFLLPLAVMVPLALRAIVSDALLPRLAPAPRSDSRPPRQAPRPAPHPAELPAPSASPSPRLPAPQSSREESRILELMARNATCPLLESRLTSRASIPFLFSLLSASHHGGPLPPEVMDAYVRAIASPREETFRAALGSISHPFLRTTEAASYLGLLRGRSASPNPENAIPILRVLSAEQPNNAVPALLLAFALHQLGDPAYAGELARALERPQFQTYAQEALQSIYYPAVEQPFLLPAALGVAEQAPFLDLLPVEDLILERLVDEDRGYAESALSFGRRIARFEAARSSREDQLFWSSLNYTIGQRTARGAWKKLHPEQPMPADLAIPREKLLARSQAQRGISERHFARAEKSALNLALCEEALPRYARGLKREWATAPLVFVGQ